MKKIYLIPLAVVLLMTFLIMPASAEFPAEFNRMDAPDIEWTGEMTYNGNAISNITEDIIEPNYGEVDVQVMTTHNCTLAYSDAYGTWAGTGTIDGFRSSSGGVDTWWNCYAQVPQGAQLLGIIAEVLDGDATDNVSLAYQVNWVGTTAVFSALVSTTGSSGSIQLLALDLSTVTPPITIDDRFYSSSAVISDNGNISTGLRSVVFFYQLQISPAPSTATFTDVPTSHWAFREIEALADSGITAGCGSGNFCPTNNVTREQMAVFLARALGLHWY